MLDMLDFFLLLLVQLEFIGVLLFSCTHVGGIVSTPVLELLLLHDHSVCADTVQEILRVRYDN